MTPGWLVRDASARLASALVTLVIASIVIFGGLSIDPGDPAVALAGSHATPAEISEVKRSLGLDHSAADRYWRWLSGVFHGNMGFSIQLRESINKVLPSDLGTTGLLVAYAFLIVFVFGMLAGVLPSALGGSFAGRVLRRLTTFGFGLGIAVPSFIAALVLTQVFSLSLHWLPALGTTAGESFGSKLEHLTLPAGALAVSWWAYLGQITRASLDEAGRAVHVETAVARGVRPSRVFRKHVLRNAEIPILTVSALTVAGLIANTVIVETFFQIDGIGSLLVSSVLAKDFNVVLDISMIFVCVFVFATTVIDFLQVLLDPRVRARVTR